MHRLWKTLWAAGLGLLLVGPAVRAQVPEKMPSPSIDDDWKYSNPGPVKSVEIGNFYLRKGNLKGALSRFQEAIKTNPHYAPAFLGLGKVYEKMGQKQKALESYKRYLDALPSEKDAEEARAAQRAVERLQKEVGTGKRSAHTIPPR
jgi:tetratricopeptide (TPR) repeat protein